MTKEVLSTFSIGKMVANYVRDGSSGSIGLELIPASLLQSVAVKRTGLAGLAEIDAIPGAGDPPASSIDPLVHLKIVGDPYPGAFAQGRTMRCSPGLDLFKLREQKVDRSGDQTTVITTQCDPAGHRTEHRLSWYSADHSAQVVTSFHNDSNLPVTLEMLTSFSLGGISPFDPAEATGRLKVHRFRSVWSAEGRLVTESIERLHLERSWSGSGLFSERFGQLGSMPVRGWFPFAAIEDTEQGVLWGAQLAWAGSWQMEISRNGDPVCISGGLADREFGHWTCTLAPGESIETPPAMLACVQGTLDDLCDQLTSAQKRAVEAQPPIEQTLPIVFNEWCTTWGDPNHDKVLSIAKQLRGSAVKYLVIDAGWYKSDGGSWDNSHGDWIPSKTLFPDGLEATAAAIRQQGLIPGIWFEMETVGSNSAAFNRVSGLLKRDGLPLTVRSRRFWDLNDPESIAYLAERVINLIERCKFGYLKVDYNETIGLGCDGADSQGEGLRRQVLGIYQIFDLIRSRLPDLVIESCSSGGHRLEPSMLARTAMSSFSDAHELLEIPIIAANLHRQMLPRQSQIWAVLHLADDERRLQYSLASTFLGRMCLSGEIDRLRADQWALVQKATAMYQKMAPVIRDGTSRRYGQIGESWRHPQGWQAVVRKSDDGNQLLIVLHTFANPPAECIAPLPEGNWAIDSSLSESSARLTTDSVIWLPAAAFCAEVLALRRIQH